jgi:serine-type D-Ala-D-Ala carboxypeptidase/endopeptidase (penicillin-binding protein 4)
MRTALASLVAAMAAVAAACALPLSEAGPAGLNPGPGDLALTEQPFGAGPDDGVSPALADLEARPAAVPQRSAYPHLSTMLRSLVVDPDLSVSGDLAIAVVDERGYPLLVHEQDRPLIPASTMKLVTAAAALRSLGPEHRYTTPVRATAPIEDGTIRGDLVLLGVGDPALTDPRFTEHAYPERPRSPVEDLADQLISAGLTTIEGDVIGDGSFLSGEPLATGTLERHLHSLDMSRMSGLTIDYGMEVEYRDDGRAIGSMAEDPAERAAVVLAEMLEDRGVAIGGVVRSGTAPRGASFELASVESPPLSTLLRYAVQRSDNHLTDGIFRTLGAVEGDPTWSGSAAATVAILSDLDLDWSGAVLADGSGLSRDDRLSAALLTELDRAMWDSEHGEEWRDLMAVAGENGTLRRRLRGTIADRRVRGKTGTLEDVRALSASVEGEGGRRFHITVIGNDLRGEARDRVRLLTDEIALRLTENLLGCVRVSVPEGASDGEGEAQEIVRCP